MQKTLSLNIQLSVQKATSDIMTFESALNTGPQLQPMRLRMSPAFFHKRDSNLPSLNKIASLRRLNKYGTILPKDGRFAFHLQRETGDLRSLGNLRRFYCVAGQPIHPKRNTTHDGFRIKKSAVMPTLQHIPLNETPQISHFSFQNKWKPPILPGNRKHRKPEQHS